MFRLSLDHGCRAIPLAWAVIPGKGLVQVEKLSAMLERVATFLALRVKAVTLLADRGCRDCRSPCGCPQARTQGGLGPGGKRQGDWAEFCRKIGWHYTIRILMNTYVTRLDESAMALTDLVPVGLNRYFQDVWLTQAAKLLTNVSVTWTVEPEMVVVISDQPTGPRRLADYARRMRIEQSFRDDQSGGFDLEHTQLRHADRLERLLLAVAIATLWCHELGEQVLSSGEDTRHIIDPGYKRELSLFQLGLRWLKRCLSTALQRLQVFQALLLPIKLAPVLKTPAS